MFGCMHVTTHGGPKLLDPLHFFLRIRHYSKGNNIVWKKGRKSYEGMGFTIHAPRYHHNSPQGNFTDLLLETAACTRSSNSTRGSVSLVLRCTSRFCYCEPLKRSRIRQKYSDFIHWWYASIGYNFDAVNDG